MIAGRFFVCLSDCSPTYCRLLPTKMSPADEKNARKACILRKLSYLCIVKKKQEQH